jgi:aspartate 1-decarboxylase
MQIEILKSKIHRATVTESNLNYIGSITIDQDLLDATGLIENERVHVYNLNNGQRFDTYIINGKRGSGEICMNGAAARLIHVGDKIIIVSYCLMNQEEAKKHHPHVILVDDNNRIKEELE